MSYILDALRKADAQRSRGTVPDLRAQPLGEATAGDAPAARRWLPWGVALLVLAAVGGGVAWWVMAPAASSVPPDGRADAAPVAAAPAAPAARALPPGPAPAADQAPPIEPALPVDPPPAAPIAEVRLLPAPVAPAAERARPASAALPPPAVAPAASAATQRVPKLAELAPDLRAQVPTLTVGGAMYSQDAANRMLIVNGQLLREGDQPAPGVVLERIQLKSAVLSVRGTRFEIAY
jgi:general secretion pathway protein B